MGPATAAQWKDELIASIVVCSAVVPESVAFADLAHCKPHIGLHTAWIVGFVCALFGGRPGMINGPTGAIAAVASQYVAAEDTGVELFVSVIVAGVLLLIAAGFRSDRLLSIMPATVMIGFCNGLALIICRAQLNWFKDGEGAWLKGVELWCTLGHCAVTFVIVLMLPKATSGRLPASLLAISIGCLAELYVIRTYVGGRTVTIGDKGRIDSVPHLFFWNSAYDIRIIGSLSKIASQSCTLALVAMLESFAALESMHELTGSDGEPNRQAWALGAANILAGLLGSMGGSSLTDLSVMNAKAGGTLRASAVFVSIWALLCVLLATPVINMVPVGSLAGIMLLVAFRTAKWHSLPMLLAAALPRAYLAGTGSSPRSVAFRRWMRSASIHRYDAFVIALVTVTTAWASLAMAVLVGLLLAYMRFVWEARDCLEIRVQDGHASRTYTLSGPLTFGAREQVSTSFQVDTDPRDVRIDFGECCILDSSGPMLLRPTLEHYAQRGVKVQLLNVPERCLPYLSRFILQVQ